MKNKRANRFLAADKNGQIMKKLIEYANTLVAAAEAGPDKSDLYWPGIEMLPVFGGNKEARP